MIAFGGQPIAAGNQRYVHITYLGRPALFRKYPSLLRQEAPLLCWLRSLSCCGPRLLAALPFLLWRGPRLAGGLRLALALALLPRRRRRRLLSGAGLGDGIRHRLRRIFFLGAFIADELGARPFAEIRLGRRHRESREYGQSREAADGEENELGRLGQTAVQTT